ncbi:hypothetical protein K661_01885 [Piscirickettsia salmonis LF-89 = ATCC VR-1361]|nr:hypothetical protein K661_01885 [Piscirickettsia salmonis LF-89 = ATCC VR-1361]
MKNKLSQTHRFALTARPSFKKILNIHMDMLSSAYDKYSKRPPRT